MLDKIKSVLKELQKKENLINMLILLIASAFICLPLLNKTIDMGYDDGIQHIARIIGTYKSIKDGQVFPVIMTNLCNNFGYSWNIFYSPFTVYFPVLFKIIGLSYIASIKLFMFLIVFASGITMYFCTKDITKNKKIALLAGILYIFTPYRLTDMYARNALAELASFIFIPMVFQGLHGVINKKDKREYLLIIGSSLLILSHTVVAMYTAIIAFLYLLINIRRLKDKGIIIKIINSSLFILVITSFFLVPLLEHKLGGNYEVFKPGRMVDEGKLVFYKLQLSQLFYTHKEIYMSFEIGLTTVFMLIITPFVINRILKSKEGDYRLFYIFSIISGLVLTVMTLEIFPFEKLPGILKMIQFSFRLLEFSSFFFAFAASVNFAELFIVIDERLKNRKARKNKELNKEEETLKDINHRNNKLKFGYFDIIVVLLVSMILSFNLKGHLNYKDDIDIKRLEEGVRIDSSTGSNHAGCATFEYLPSNAFENRWYIEERSDDVIVVDKDAEIIDKEKHGTTLTCKIENAEEGTIIELPYIYYLGYKIELKQDNRVIELKPFETEYGFVGVKLPEVKDGILKVTYVGTTLMKITYVISFSGIIFILGCLIKGRYLLKTKSNIVKK